MRFSGLKAFIGSAPNPASRFEPGYPDLASAPSIIATAFDRP